MFVDRGLNRIQSWTGGALPAGCIILWIIWRRTFSRDSPMPSAV